MKKIIVSLAAAAIAIAIGVSVISYKGKKSLTGTRPKMTSSAQKSLHSLRKEPAAVPYDYNDRGRYKRIFRLQEDGKPLEYIGNEYRDNGNETITDHATGLTWQKSDSEESFYRDEEVRTYLKELNDRKFAGYSDWRIPTIDELKTLIEPEKQSNDLYISPIFNTKQDCRCISSDTRQYGSTWAADFNEGKIVPSYGYIRAVRP